MDASRPHDVQELFDEALTVPKAERPAFLARLVADAPGPGREVEELLAYYGRAEEEAFLEGETGEKPASEVGADLAATRLGPYQILSLIAQGGMGAVYRARRVADFEQDVAIKVTHGATVSAELTIRFQAERQFLTRLAHPNIARLLDGGVTPDGRPYLVMEYVEGQRIDRAAEGLGLNVADRVRLLLQAADAIEYAHTQGVVHRDLKPANILVTASRSVRLVDFGLARSTQSGDVPSLTETGAFVGTPGYAAPEQVGGCGRAVGPATDVYALGAVLYELLTGRAPFRAENIFETLRQVQEDDPIPPAVLTPGLPRDLETVCLKCLQKDPAQRYPSARELADDLGRFLNGEPVRAMPIGRIERAVRWCRRKPWQAVQLALLAAVTVTAFVAVTVQWRQAQRRLALAQEGVDLLIDADFERLRVPHPVDPEQRAKLLRGVAIYRELLDDGGDPARTAAGLQKAARIYYDTGDSRQALPLYQQAIALYGRLESQFDRQPGYRLERARCYCQAANCLSVLARDDEAEEPLRRAVAEAEVLTRRYPEEVVYQGALACHQAGLGTWLMNRGFDDEAEALFTAARAAEEMLLRRHPEDPQRYVRLAAVLGLQGYLAQKRGSDRALLDSFRERDRLAHELAARFPTNPATGDLVRNAPWCNVLFNQGKPDEAAAVLRRGIDLLRSLARRFPAVASFRLKLLRDLEVLGYLRWESDRPEAERSFRECKALLEQLAADFPEQPDYRARVSQILAQCPDPAIRDVKQAVTLARPLAEQHRDNAYCQHVLAIALGRAGAWDEAAAILGSSLPRPYRLPSNQTGFAADLFRVMAAWHTGKQEQARADFEVLTQAFKGFKETGPDVWRVHDEAARLLGTPSVP